MKKLYAVLIGLCLTVLGHAVAISTPDPDPIITKLTLNVTPGGLGDLIPLNERAAITSLNLTGSIDARDFTTMRDSLPALESVDISAVDIVSYKGPLGPGGDTYYDSKHIPHRSFYQKSLLTTFIVPATLQSIGNNAFRGSNLSGVFDVPEAVTSIGSYVFSGCENLTEVIIHDNVTRIGGYAFEKCTGLSEINLPDGLTEIGNSAFRECSSLTSIHIPASVNDLGSSAFRDCIRLSSVTLNASISVLESYMFRGDTAIKGTLVLPETLSAVETSAFEKCSGIDTIYVPNAVKSIGELAFADCKGLKAIALPDTLNYISAKTFLNDSLLETVEMPLVLDSICLDAFRNCVSIKTMVIADVKHIGENAFRSCSGLDTIFSLGRTPVDLTNSPNVFHFVEKEACRLIVAYKSLDAYKGANQWQDFFNIEEAISFNIDSLASSADGTKVDSVTATSGLTWDVSAEEEWVTVTPATGRGDKVFKFTLVENDGESSRETKVTFNIYDLFTETLSILQKASPVITWELPKSITVGTEISTELLNANANIDGEFTYSPEIGMVIGTEASQEFSVSFVPADTVNYSPVVFTKNISIGKKTPEVEITYPDEIGSGTVLTKELLVVDTELEGTITCDPTFGTTLSEGDDQIIKVTFTPTDTANYKPLVKTLIVDIAAASVTTGGISNVEVNKESDNKGEVIIAANTNWTISIDADWLTATPTSGFKADTIKFEASANTSGEERSTTVTISADGMEDVTITVVQESEGKTAVDNIAAIDLKAYPNPAADQLTISGFEGVASVQVYDLTGKLVISTTLVANEQVIVSDLITGVYFAVVKSKESSTTIKLIKK